MERTTIVKTLRRKRAPRQRVRKARRRTRARANRISTVSIVKALNPSPASSRSRYNGSTKEVVIVASELITTLKAQDGFLLVQPLNPLFFPTNTQLRAMGSLYAHYIIKAVTATFTPVVPYTIGGSLAMGFFPPSAGDSEIIEPYAFLMNLVSSGHGRLGMETKCKLDVSALTIQKAYRVDGSEVDANPINFGVALSGIPNGIEVDDPVGSISFKYTYVLRSRRPMLSSSEINHPLIENPAIDQDDPVVVQASEGYKIGNEVDGNTVIGFLTRKIADMDAGTRVKLVYSAADLGWKIYCATVGGGGWGLVVAVTAIAANALKQYLLTLDASDAQGF